MSPLLPVASEPCARCGGHVLRVGDELRCPACAPYLRCPDCGASVSHQAESGLWLCDGAECAWAATEAPWTK